jgi:hypothetical protein
MKPDQAISLWTNGRLLVWRNVQNYKRGYEILDDGKKIKYTSANAETKSVANGMTRYFRQKALRKPYVPPGETVDGLLYRGVLLTSRQYDALIKRMTWTDRGFMAFSTTFDIAEAAVVERNVSLKAVIFYLPKEKIPNGTPWVWFGRPNARSQYMPKNKVRSRHGPSSEVLLLPGKLRAFRIQYHEPTDITYVGVYYYSGTQRR